MYFSQSKGLLANGNNQTTEVINTNCITGNGYYCLQKVINDGWKISDLVWNR